MQYIRSRLENRDGMYCTDSTDWRSGLGICYRYVYADLVLIVHNKAQELNPYMQDYL